jgi:hypothetical protein
MKMYAEVPSFRLRQVLGDAGATAWTTAWAATGVWTHELVARLAAPGRSIEQAGASFARPFAVAGRSVAGIPGVGDALGAPLRSAAGAGRVLAAAGVSQQQGVRALALWLAVVLAILPIALVLSRYLPRRLRWMREAAAARRLRADGADLELFALRAVANRRLSDLGAVCRDPVRALATGDHEALARLELGTLGLRP